MACWTRGWSMRSHQRMQCGRGREIGTGSGDSDEALRRSMSRRNIQAVLRGTLRLAPSALSTRPALMPQLKRPIFLKIIDGPAACSLNQFRQPSSSEKYKNSFQQLSRPHHIAEKSHVLLPLPSLIPHLLDVCVLAGDVNTSKLMVFSV